MEINLSKNDIDHYGTTKFDENIAILKKDSEYFKKFHEFVRENTNFFQSRISLMEIQYITDDADGVSDFLILKLSGGKNGTGNWVEYLDDIQILVANFSKQYHTWLVDIDNDCFDDIFYMTICIR